MTPNDNVLLSSNLNRNSKIFASFVNNFGIGSTNSDGLLETPSGAKKSSNINSFKTVEKSQKSGKTNENNDNSSHKTSSHTK